jgi:hypothetical protein
MAFRRVIREPLLHFFLLGAALFLLFGWLNRGAMEAPDEVVVDQARIESLVAQFQRVWQRSPTPAEAQGLIDNWIREEIMYREGVALGLDVNDSVVRRRIAQKMAFIADGAVPTEPTEAELQDWLQSDIDEYRLEPVYSLQQVYFDPARHRDDLAEHLTKLRSTLADDGSVPEGDATLLPGSLQSARASEVARTFGSEFADAIADLPVAEWQGPLESAYGLHLVKLDGKTPGREPTLAEVRNAVERDWSAAQSEKLNEAFYRAVRERYTVRMAADAAAVPAPVTSGSR